MKTVVVFLGAGCGTPIPPRSFSPRLGLRPVDCWSEACEAPKSLLEHWVVLDNCDWYYNGAVYRLASGLWRAGL